MELVDLLLCRRGCTDAIDTAMRKRGLQRQKRCHFEPTALAYSQAQVKSFIATHAWSTAPVSAPLQSKRYGGLRFYVRPRLSLLVARLIVKLLRLSDIFAAEISPRRENDPKAELERSEMADEETG